VNEPTGAVYVSRWPLGAVVALVLLRLVIGWHFWSEGTHKLAYNANTGETHVAFSAEPMLRTAVGPVGEWIRADLPNFHQWEQLLAVPKSAGDALADAAERAKWEAEYKKRRDEAAKKKEPAPLEFPPKGAGSAWANRIAADWDRTVAAFSALPGLTEDQKEAAGAALSRRKQQLADYMAGEEGSIAEWQHELSRLAAWQTGPDSEDLPFQKSRIAEKKAETTAGSAGWVSQVREFEASLFADLRSILTDEQAKDAVFVDRVNDVTRDENERKLAKINFAVTCLIIGVGACLLLGLFTRLAALGGIAFLCMVVATQLPWVPGAIPTYNQIVEIAALVVLFAVGAGRWFGLDFFLRALFTKWRGRTETVTS
jgi:uncharacterized membrane protein YphA (DoxX/SURF4 family)